MSPDLIGWDVITADGERAGTVTAVHGSGADGAVEVALTATGAGRGGAPPAAEELRAAERGREVSHLRATEGRPPGIDLLGDVSPGPGAHHGSPEEPVRPPGTEETVRDRLGGGHVRLPLAAVRFDRAGRRVMALRHTLADLSDPAAVPSR